MSIYLAAQDQSLSADSSNVQEDTVRGICITQDAVSVFWPGVGEFVVRRGEEIVVIPAAGVDEVILRLPLLSAVMAILLHQRGFMVLHASAVEVGDKAVAFLGPKGRGKSSMAATLYARGHRIITDDVLAVHVKDGKATVLPAFPHVKLWRGVAAAVLDAQHLQNLSPLYDGIDKGFCLVGDRFVDNPIELHQIYILEEALPSTTANALLESVDLLPLENQQTLVELIRHSYLGGLSSEFIERWQAEHFQNCANLVGLVAGFCLYRSPSLASLMPAASAVEENALISVKTF